MTLIQKTDGSQTKKKIKDTNIRGIYSELPKRNYDTKVNVV